MGVTPLQLYEQTAAAAPHIWVGIPPELDWGGSAVCPLQGAAVAGLALRCPLQMQAARNRFLGLAG